MRTDGAARPSPSGVRLKRHTGWLSAGVMVKVLRNTRYPKSAVEVYGREPCPHTRPQVTTALLAAHQCVQLQPQALSRHLDLTVQGPALKGRGRGLLRRQHHQHDSNQCVDDRERQQQGPPLGLPHVLEALRRQVLNAQGNQRGEQAEKDDPSPHVSDEGEARSCGDYKRFDEHPWNELPASGPSTVLYVENGEHRQGWHPQRDKDQPERIPHHVFSLECLSCW